MDENGINIIQVGIRFYNREGREGYFIPFNSINSIGFEPAGVYVSYGQNQNLLVEMSLEEQDILLSKLDRLSIIVDDAKERVGGFEVS